MFTPNERDYDQEQAYRMPYQKLKNHIEEVLIVALLQFKQFTHPLSCFSVPVRRVEDVVGKRECWTPENVLIFGRVQKT